MLFSSIFNIPFTFLHRVADLRSFSTFSIENYFKLFKRPPATTKDKASIKGQVYTWLVIIHISFLHEKIKTENMKEKFPYIQIC